MIKRLVAGAKGAAGNSTGSDIATAVNHSLSASDAPNSVFMFGDSITAMNWAPLSTGLNITVASGTGTMTITGANLTKGTVIRFVKTSIPTLNAVNDGYSVVTGVTNANTFTFSAVGVSDGTSTAGEVMPHDRNSFAGYFTSAMMMSGQPFVVSGNGAMSGDDTSEALARISEPVNASARMVMVLLGTNDAFTSIPIATAKANILSIVEQILDSGKDVLLGTILPIQSPAVPSGGNTLQQTAEYIVEYNAHLRSIADSDHRVTLVDFYSVVVDPDSAVGAAKAGLIADGVHPTNLGGMTMGRLLGSLLSRRYEPRVRVSSSIAGTAQKLLNPLFIGNGGAIPAGFSGDLANNWSLIRTGALTATMSKEANTDGAGYIQRATVTASADFERFIITSENVSSLLSAGDKVVFSARVNFGDMTKIRTTVIKLLSTIDGVTSTGISAGIMTLPATAPFPSDTGTLSLVTLEWEVPAGVTNVQARLDATFNGTGNTTIDVSQFSIEVVG